MIVLTVEKKSSFSFFEKILIWKSIESKKCDGIQKVQSETEIRIWICFLRL